MKKDYEIASVEVVKIDGGDVIATSQKPTTGNNGDNEVDAGGKW